MLQPSRCRENICAGTKQDTGQHKVSKYVECEIEIENREKQLISIKVLPYDEASHYYYSVQILLPLKLFEDDRTEDQK